MSRFAVVEIASASRQKEESNGNAKRKWGKNSVYHNNACVYGAEASAGSGWEFAWGRDDADSIAAISNRTRWSGGQSGSTLLTPSTGLGHIRGTSVFALM